MDYRVNCAPRGNIKFRRATSSWMKLIKSSIRSVIPSLGIDDSSLQEDSNETPETEEIRFESSWSPFKFCSFDFLLLLPLAFSKFARRTDRLLAIER